MTEKVSEFLNLCDASRLTSLASDLPDDVSECSGEQLIVKLAFCAASLYEIPGPYDEDTCVGMYTDAVNERNEIVELLEDHVDLANETMMMIDIFDHQLQATQEIMLEHFSHL